MRRLIAPGAAAACASMLIVGCGSSGRTTRAGPRPPISALALSSSAFLNGSSIPTRYTCDGQDISPPLAWTRAPAGARSLALLVEDHDAPGGAFVHWSVYELPPSSSGTGSGHLPAGSAEGRNSFGRVGYGGPCPPKGDRPHHYVFSIHALGASSGLSRGASPAVARKAIAAHAIAAGTVTGLYRR
jgi:Raf kinase inhibitor-like YbhB/YbcL family protein